MLAHLKPFEHAPHLLADLGLIEWGAGPPCHLAGNAGEFPLGCGKELFALPLPFFSEERIEAGDEPFVRIVVRGDLGKVRLVEERQLEGTAFDQVPDSPGA